MRKLTSMAPVTHGVIGILALRQVIKLPRGVHQDKLKQQATSPGPACRLLAFAFGEVAPQLLIGDYSLPFLGCLTRRILQGQAQCWLLT